MLFLQFIRPEYCRCVTRLFVDHSSLLESSLDISIVECNLNEDLIFFTQIATSMAGHFQL